MGKIRLSDEVIQAREDAQKAREKKPMEQVIREIRKERRARELLQLKRVMTAL